MKKIIFSIILIFSFCAPIYAAEIEETSIEPKASYVFSHVTSTITKYAYGGDSSLMDIGSGTISVYLQKKNSSGSWETVDGSKSSKTYSETMTVSHAQSKNLTSGTWRCKTYIIGYVNGYTDRRTVYSPALTIK